eukprot:TRINITY_DN21392_c0_g1_i1.p1 TRINITY_DN21392_c0_g1~~TRINITY_DN21392_c0_g1_i1.p1  ORF type:complete len:472 (+),score=120.19 TRINITY_DN21392_c0_g1_i1:76-1416(+)
MAAKGVGASAPARRSTGGYSAAPASGSPPPPRSAISQSAPARPSAGGSPPPRRTSAAGAPPPLRRPSASGSSAQASGSRSPGGALFRTFRDFASFGKGTELQEHMDRVQFVKLCKDCHLFDRTFTQPDAELVFTAASRPSLGRTIGFEQFKKALSSVAHKKGMTEAALEKQIGRVWCPSIGDATYHGVYGGSLESEVSVERSEVTCTSSSVSPPPRHSFRKSGGSAKDLKKKGSAVLMHLSRAVSVHGDADDEDSQRMCRALAAAGVEVSLAPSDPALFSGALRSSGFTGGRFALPVIAAQGRAWWKGEGDKGNFTTTEDLIRQLAALGLATAPASGGSPEPVPGEEPASAPEVVVYGPEQCAGSTAVRAALREAGVPFTDRSPDSEECDAAIDRSDFPGGRLVLPVVEHRGSRRVWWRTADGMGNWADPADLASKVIAVAVAQAA